MRLRAVHTAPLWQEDDGSRTVGLAERPNHPPVVGWVNAAVIRLGRDMDPRWFLLTRDATDAD